MARGSLPVDPVEGVLLTALEDVPVGRFDAIVRDRVRWITERLRYTLDSLIAHG